MKVLIMRMLLLKSWEFFSIMEDIEVTCVSIMGDWNADISDGDSVFGTKLRVFCEENNVILSSEQFLYNKYNVMTRPLYFYE